MGHPALAVSCAGCGTPIPAGLAACPACGVAAIPAERRFVTLLFADLAGYTALCEDRDPEDVHLIVRPLMNALRRRCEEAGGIVPNIEGDGFMAAFGARLAQEDDPTRALDCAVALQEAVASRQALMPELPGLHVGLHVGEVVVAASTHAAGFSLMGDAVNVASRLCGRASEGQVLATSEFAHLTAVDGWGDPTSLILRGRQEVVQVRAFDWQAAGDLLSGRGWSAESPYVSRAELEQGLAHVIADPPGALVVGDAGLGKSRLVGEVLGDRPVLRVTCVSALFPSATDLAVELLTQLDRVPHELVRLLTGMEIMEAGERDDESLLRAAARSLGALEPRPIVVIDDAERLPDSELPLLEVLQAESDLIWIVISRRQLDLPLVHVQVGSLSPAESVGMLEELLPSASRELREAVLHRAGDSPLFLEQCCRLLLENGAVTLDRSGATLVDPERLRDIPTSMRLFVSGRLDLLPRHEREIVGVASVLGASPAADLLRHLTKDDGEGVESLVERGLLRWVPGRMGQPELAFSHALVRDVAYASMLRSRRAAIHRAAADWYAVLPVSQVLEAQAYHLEHAVQLQGGDCELLRQTVEAMVLFARSIEEERTRLSREVLGRARALVNRRPECSTDVLSLELASSAVALIAGDSVEGVAAAERALSLSVTGANRSAQAEAELLIARGDVDPASVGETVAHLDRAEAIFEELGDLGGQARTALHRALRATIVGGTAQFVAAFEGSYKLAMRSGDARLQATCAQQLAFHHAISTGRENYELWAVRAEEVSRADDVCLRPRLDLAEAALALFGLHPSAGVDAALSALEAGRKLGLANVYSNAVVASADLLLLGGRYDECRAVLDEGRRIGERRASEWHLLQLDLLEARVAQRTRATNQAILLLESVAQHTLADSPLLRHDLAEARAWVALERGDFPQARALAGEAVLLDEEMGDRCPMLRPRLVELVATIAMGESPSLGDTAALRTLARSTGLTTISELANRWLYVDELTRGWTVDLHGLTECDVIECRALDLEIEALSTRNFNRLVDAAAVWAELGTTVWQARSLLWHAELTGADHPEAHELVEVLQSPAGLAEFFQRQVRGLKA